MVKPCADIANSIGYVTSVDAACANDTLAPECEHGIVAHTNVSNNVTDCICDMLDHISPRKTDSATRLARLSNYRNAVRLRFGTGMNGSCCGTTTLMRERGSHSVMLDVR
jgi:ethanolamine ammonia-lyase small subunit